MNKNKSGKSAKRLYSYLPFLDSPRAYALIDTEALIHNYKLLLEKARAVNPIITPIATVKADAYGHSASICVPALLSAGCRNFAVSSIEEALDVRHITETEGFDDAEILILGYTDPKYAHLAIEHNITLSLVSPEYVKRLSEVIPENNLLKCHVAVDTGMNRLGFPAHTEKDREETAAAVAEIFEDCRFSVLGAFSHFYRADSDGESGDTKEQYRRFIDFTEKLESKGVGLTVKHICNTAGIMLYPEYALDAVRMGISLYGALPFDSDDNLGFRPVMRLCTIVSHIHTVKAGECIGYGGAYTAEKDITVATIPIGYADGFIRAYGGADVGVCGGRARIVGRICMDQCMIDISEIEGVKVGDEVTLFGNHPSELTALARRSGSIEYECLCIVSSRIPRIKK